jgi:hypothetical protein
MTDQNTPPAQAGDPALPTLLRLLSDPPPRFVSVQATYRTWRHESRVREARHADVERARAGGGSVTSYSPSTDDPRPSESAEITHVWREANRLRCEIHGGVRDGYRSVTAGDAWWTWDPRVGGRSNEHDRSVSRQSYGQPPFMLDPARLVALLQFQIAGGSEVAGRATVTVRATPLAPNPISGVTLALYALGPGAEHYQIEVDRERGVLLACAAVHRDQPIQTITAETISFDDPLPPELFAVDPGTWSQ